jgi:hypothetical protein
VDTPNVATVTEVMFVNTWCEIEYHFDMCQAIIGAHIESYLVTKEVLSFVHPYIQHRFDSRCYPNLCNFLTHYLFSFIVN